MTSSKLQSQGVQEFIDRLHQDGVVKGEQLAQEIIQDAKRQSEKMMSEAKNEAARMIAEAKINAESEKQAATEALNLAYRDASHKLKELVSEQFALRLGRLVKQELDQKDFLQKVILSLTSIDELDESFKKQALEVWIPKKMFDVEALRTDASEAKESEFSQFVRSLANTGLREGVSIKLSESDESGVRVRLVKERIEINFSDEAITALLLKHTMPRFRALLDGIV